MKKVRYIFFWLKCKIKRIPVRLKCWWSGGHDKTMEEWGFDFIKNVGYYVCPKCNTTLSEVPPDCFPFTDRASGIRLGVLEELK